MRRMLLMVCLAVFASIGLADDELRYNQVRLQSQQTESVSNDTMQTGHPY
jgi:predicted secreted protein